MGPLLVVFQQPGLDDVAHLVEGFEHVGIKYFVAEGAIEALDEGVLVGLPGLDKLNSMCRSWHHSVNAVEVSSLPLSSLIARGLP